jgi:hypothetical protein
MSDARARRSADRRRAWFLCVVTVAYGVYCAIARWWPGVALAVTLLGIALVRRRRVEPIRHDGLEWCGSCGAALGTDKKRGNSMYAQYVSYRDFEQILLSLGASGSDVQRLWLGEVPVE